METERERERERRRVRPVSRAAVELEEATDGASTKKTGPASLGRTEISHWDTGDREKHRPERVSSPLPLTLAVRRRLARGRNKKTTPRVR